MNSSSHLVKRAPQRTCVACKKVTAKQELVRLVRVPDGSVEVDETGKKAGRGAYLCRAEDCWDTGIKNGRLEHTLRTALSPENKEKLVEFGQSLFRNGNRGQD